jgi:hypothetical protein
VVVAVVAVVAVRVAIEHLLAHRAVELRQSQESRLLSAQTTQSQLVLVELLAMVELQHLVALVAHLYFQRLHPQVVAVVAVQI